MILILGIIIHLIIFTLLAVVIALPLAGIVCWLSRKHRKRNTILALLSPFVFIYSFYFTGLVGDLPVRQSLIQVAEWMGIIRLNCLTVIR